MVIKITPDGMPQLGIVETKTSNFGGHPPEFCNRKYNSTNATIRTRPTACSSAQARGSKIVSFCETNPLVRD